MTPTSKQFNVYFTQHTREQLDEVAHKRQVTGAVALRQMIHDAHTMEIRRIPCCANRSPCNCPHLQPPQPQNGANNNA